jgi:hypothetical protein
LEPGADVRSVTTSRVWVRQAVPSIDPEKEGDNLARVGATLTKAA